MNTGYFCCQALFFFLGGDPPHPLDIPKTDCIRSCHHKLAAHEQAREPTPGTKGVQHTRHNVPCTVSENSMQPPEQVKLQAEGLEQIVRQRVPMPSSENPMCRLAPVLQDPHVKPPKSFSLHAPPQLGMLLNRVLEMRVDLVHPPLSNAAPCHTT